PPPIEALVALNPRNPVFTIRRNAVDVGTAAIPTDRHGQLILNFTQALRGPASPAYVSAADVLEGRVEPGRLSGKVVLVGVTDPSLGDHYLAPDAKGGGSPGVFFEANALNTMLTRSYLRPSSDLENVTWA